MEMFFILRWLMDSNGFDLKTTVLPGDDCHVTVQEYDSFPV